MSMPEMTALPKKRLRRSCAGYPPDDETSLQDTDPNHPTSSMNLRTKGRNLKNSKKLSEFDTLMKTNKLVLHSNQTINDVVNGEVLIMQSVKSECYFRVSGSGSTGKMLLQKIQEEASTQEPSDILVTEVVNESNCRETYVGINY